MSEVPGERQEGRAMLGPSTEWDLSSFHIPAILCHLNNNNNTIYWALAVCQARCKVLLPALPQLMLTTTL